MEPKKVSGSLAVVNPTLAKQWHPTKNITTPNLVSANKNAKVWWLGECGHEWEATISNRNALGRGCPYCSGQRVLAGFNDLRTLHPDIAKEFLETENNVSVDTVSPGSHKKFIWECSFKHQWVSNVDNRTRKGYGCPYCSGRKVISGVNDLATINPEVAEQWHPTKNQPLLPSMVKAGSEMSVWWVCEKGHEWEAAVYSRKHNNCRVCGYKKFISQQEQELCDFFLTRNLLVEQSNRSILNGAEIDIYLPEKQVAVEFNGLYWHSESAGKDQWYHYNKWLVCKEQGIELVQVWEDDWKRNPDLVKRMLEYKLGFGLPVDNTPNCSVNNLYTTVISLSEAEKFLEHNHLKGFTVSDYYGLKEEVSTGEKIFNDITAVIGVVFDESTNECEIVRFAATKNAFDNFNILLQYVESLGYRNIIGFSDNCFSDDLLYQNNGFVLTEEIPPDYMVYVDRKRVDKNAISFTSSNDRVWDAGKIKWVKKVR